MSDVIVSPKWSWAGSQATTIRHAITGFFGGGIITVSKMILPALDALKAGDWSVVLALKPLSLLGAFIGGGAAVAVASALARWAHFVVTDQEVVK